MKRFEEGLKANPAMGSILADLLRPGTASSILSRPSTSKSMLAMMDPAERYRLRSNDVLLQSAESKDGHLVAGVRRGNELTVHVWYKNNGLLKHMCPPKPMKSKSGLFRPVITPVVSEGPSFSSGPVGQVLFSPYSNLIAACGQDVIKVWDTRTGKLISTLRGHTDVVTCLCFSNDNRVLVSGSADETVKVWDIKKGRLIASIPGTGAVKSITFSENSCQFAVARCGPDSRTQVEIFDFSIFKETGAGEESGEQMKIIKQRERAVAAAAKRRELEEKRRKLLLAMAGNKMSEETRRLLLVDEKELKRLRKVERTAKQKGRRYVKRKGKRGKGDVAGKTRRREKDDVPSEAESWMASDDEESNKDSTGAKVFGVSRSDGSSCDESASSSTSGSDLHSSDETDDSRSVSSTSSTSSMSSMSSISTRKDGHRRTDERSMSSTLSTSSTTRVAPPLLSGASPSEPADPQESDTDGASTSSRDPERKPDIGSLSRKYGRRTKKDRKRRSSVRSEVTERGERVADSQTAEQAPSRRRKKEKGTKGKKSRLGRSRSRFLSVLVKPAQQISPEESSALRAKLVASLDLNFQPHQQGPDGLAISDTATAEAELPSSAGELIKSPLRWSKEALASEAATRSGPPILDRPAMSPLSQPLHENDRRVAGGIAEKRLRVKGKHPRDGVRYPDGRGHRSSNASGAGADEGELGDHAHGSLREVVPSEIDGYFQGSAGIHDGAYGPGHPSLSVKKRLPPGMTLRTLARELGLTEDECLTRDPEQLRNEYHKMRRRGRGVAQDESVPGSGRGHNSGSESGASLSDYDDDDNDDHGGGGGDGGYDYDGDGGDDDDDGPGGGGGGDGGNMGTGKNKRIRKKASGSKRRRLKRKPFEHPQRTTPDAAHQHRSRASSRENEATSAEDGSSSPGEAEAEVELEGTIAGSPKKRGSRHWRRLSSVVKSAYQGEYGGQLVKIQKSEEVTVHVASNRLQRMSFQGKDLKVYSTDSSQPIRLEEVARGNDGLPPEFFHGNASSHQTFPMPDELKGGESHTDPSAFDVIPEGELEEHGHATEKKSESESESESRGGGADGCGGKTGTEGVDGGGKEDVFLLVHESAAESLAGRNPTATDSPLVGASDLKSPQKAGPARSRGEIDTGTVKHKPWVAPPRDKENRPHKQSPRNGLEPASSPTQRPRAPKDETLEDDSADTRGGRVHHRSPRQSAGHAAAGRTGSRAGEGGGQAVAPKGVPSGERQVSRVAKAREDHGDVDDPKARGHEDAAGSGVGSKVAKKKDSAGTALGGNSNLEEEGRSSSRPGVGSSGKAASQRLPLQPSSANVSPPAAVKARQRGSETHPDGIVNGQTSPPPKDDFDFSDRPPAGSIEYYHGTLAQITRERIAAEAEYRQTCAGQHTHEGWTFLNAAVPPRPFRKYEPLRAFASEARRLLVQPETLQQTKHRLAPGLITHMSERDLQHEALRTPSPERTDSDADEWYSPYAGYKLRHRLHLGKPRSRSDHRHFSRAQHQQVAALGLSPRGPTGLCGLRRHPWRVVPKCYLPALERIAETSPPHNGLRGIQRETPAWLRDADVIGDHESVTSIPPMSGLFLPKSNPRLLTIPHRPFRTGASEPLHQANHPDPESAGHGPNQNVDALDCPQPAADPADPSDSRDAPVGPTRPRQGSLAVVSFASPRKRRAVRLTSMQADATPLGPEAGATVAKEPGTEARDQV
eukprot:Rmarinus@m.11192